MHAIFHIRTVIIPQPISITHIHKSVWEVNFDIGGIVNHHCLNFIICTLIYINYNYLC